MKMPWAVPIAAMLTFGLLTAVPTPAQQDAARAAKCNPVKLDWNKANAAGIPGRRKAMKAVVDAARADPVIGECLSEKIREDLVIAAYGSSAAQGWAAVLKMNSNNFTAAKDQAPADQCAASKLVISGWNAFYATRKDIGAQLDASAQRRHRELCPGSA